MSGDNDHTPAPGIANVWMCKNVLCGRFEFVKPESDDKRAEHPEAYAKGRKCVRCGGSMTLLEEQAVIQVRARPPVVSQTADAIVELPDMMHKETRGGRKKRRGR